MSVDRYQTCFFLASDSHLTHSASRACAVAPQIAAAAAAPLHSRITRCPCIVMSAEGCCAREAGVKGWTKGGQGVRNAYRGLRQLREVCLGTGGKVMFTPSIVPARSEFSCETTFVWQMYVK